MKEFEKNEDILAYYQYETGVSFRYIHSQIKMCEIKKMYYPLHEASENKFVEALNKRIKSKYTTRLQQRRKLMGLSQNELSKKANMSLRSLQEYEIGGRDINKANALTLHTIAKVLHCQIDDIMELIK